MTRVLVTGANGFIGSHLVRELLSRKYEIHCLVRRTSDLFALDGLPVSLFVGDLREPETLVAPVTGVDYVYHVGAVLLTTDQETFDSINTRGTRNLLEAAVRHAPSLKRFLYVSSETAVGPAPTTKPLDESAPCRPVSWYGLSKKNAEEIVLAYSAQVPVTIVRPSSVYGERERDVSQAFPIVDMRIQPKIGILDKYLVMVYVGDLTKGMIAAAESPKTIRQTYFLNHPELLTPKRVVKTIAAAAGKPFGLSFPVPTVTFSLLAPVAEVVYQFNRERPRTTRDKAREIAQRYWVADPAKARRDFGWEAKTALFDGMKRCLDYYRAEEAQLRAMPLEKPGTRALKYLLSGCILGAVIESISHLAGFYSFQPWWLIFVIIFAGFGFGLGLLAMALREKGLAIQFLVPSVLVGAVEALNVAWFHAWTFAPGWPLGITDPWLRSAVLGLAGGIGTLVLNALMRALYKRRLRLG